MIIQEIIDAKAKFMEKNGIEPDYVHISIDQRREMVEELSRAHIIASNDWQPDMFCGMAVVVCSEPGPHFSTQKIQ